MTLTAETKDPKFGTRLVLTRIYSRSFFTQFTQRCIEKVQQTLIDFIPNTTENIKKRFSQINAKFIADFGKMLFINLLIFDKDNK